MQIVQELKKRQSAQRKLRICATCAICAACATCELFCATPTSEQFQEHISDHGHRISEKMSLRISVL